MAKQITRSRCQPARGPVGGERTASCVPARGPVARGRGRCENGFLYTSQRTRGRRENGFVEASVPKATLDILGAYAEALFRAIFGLELDCGKLWRSKSLGAGVNQPEDPWEGRERLLVYQPEDPWPEDPWEVRERLLVYQPEDPWEVRERLCRGFRGVSVTAGGLKRG